MLNQILAASRDEIHNAFRLITDRYAPLMRFLAGLHMPSVKNLAMAMEAVLNSELRRQFENPTLWIWSASAACWPNARPPKSISIATSSPMCSRGISTG